MKPNYYTRNEVVAMLRDDIREETQAAWAERNGMSPAYLSDVLSLRRDPGPKILEVLGLEAVFGPRTYRKKGLKVTERLGLGR